MSDRDETFTEHSSHLPPEFGTFKSRIRRKTVARRTHVRMYVGAYVRMYVKEDQIAGISMVSGDENMQNFTASSIFWSVWHGFGQKGAKIDF